MLKRSASIPFFLAAIIVVFLVKNNVFFWDTIQLGAKQGWWFYENGFDKWILPTEIDSGHPPVFGMYLALMWKVFGRTLPVSHFAMLPFLFGIIFFSYRIGGWLAGFKWAPLLLLLLFADPTLAAQCILISPDVILVLGFLAVLYGVFSERPSLKMAGALLLAMISLRGMMIVVVLFLFDILRSFLPGMVAVRGPIFSFLAKKALPYFPSGIFTLAFLGYHYAETGWIGYHADSPWAPAFERADSVNELIYNMGILGWRLIDHGRVFIWAALFLLLWPEIKKRTVGQRTGELLMLAGIALLVLSPSLLLHKYLLNHRYLLPVYLSVTLLFFQLVSQKDILPVSRRNFIYTMTILGLFTGNLWIYPPRIAQGWDATLAHLPHYALRDQALDFLDRSGIPYQEVGASFPERGPLKFHDLSDRETGFMEKDLDSQQYIFYANTMNDFTDEELSRLQTDWKELFRVDRRGVFMIIYGRK